VCGFNSNTRGWQFQKYQSFCMPTPVNISIHRILRARSRLITPFLNAVLTPP
jgi:hypothetical protein